MKGRIWKISQASHLTQYFHSLMDIPSFRPWHDLFYSIMIIIPTLLQASLVIDHIIFDNKARDAIFSLFGLIPSSQNLRSGRLEVGPIETDCLSAGFTTELSEALALKFNGR
jgi:hypothetical protein